MKQLIFLLGTAFLCNATFAQTDGWVPVSPNAGMGSCWDTKDLIIDARPGSENRFNRFGILHNGTWGSNTNATNVDLASQYLTLGPIDLGTAGVGPSSSRLYGFASSMNTDRMFVGLRYIDTTSCVTGISVNNHTEAVIAWGQDHGGDKGWTADDKLKFMFYNESLPNLGSPLTIMTMTPQGNVGIGTEAPTDQLHTTGSVRFEGLTSGPVTDLVGIDANGVLFRTTGSGGNNSCTAINLLPKTTSASGDLGCSQLYDNGTSVGINTTSGFGYTSLASSLTGATLPPSSGTIRLDIAGVTRSLAYIATSDERLKTNVNTLTNTDEIVKALSGKTYFWNNKVQKDMAADGGLQYGFLAQEVEKIMPGAVVKDENGNYGINYNSFIPVLVESQKNLYKLYEEEKTEKELLKLELESLKTKVEQLAIQFNKESQTSNISKSGSNVLFQNTPNPFNKETTIEYTIDRMKNNGFIVVFDMNGKELLKFKADLGKGSVLINSEKLSSGMYLYSLVVDGLEVDTKRMVLTK